MPRRLTLATINTRALQQADLDKDGAFTDTAVCYPMASLQYGDLYQVVASAGGRYFETSITTTMAGGVNTISEPSDHLSTVDTIERIVNTTTGLKRRLRQLMPQERSLWSGKTGHAKKWEIVDDTIYLYPTPPAGDQYVLRYIPQATDLSTSPDGTIVDVVTADGEAFMIWGLAYRFLAKIRSDVTVALQEREAARERLAEWAAMRAFNEPTRSVVDMDDDDYPYRDGEWWYDR